MPGDKNTAKCEKISNIRSFLFFKVAKRFARNLFAPYYHTNICKVTIRIWIPLRCFTGLSLFSFYLPIRNVKRSILHTVSFLKRMKLCYLGECQKLNHFRRELCIIQKYLQNKSQKNSILGTNFFRVWYLWPIDNNRHFCSDVIVWITSVVL